MAFKLLGMGTALPQHAIAQHEAVELAVGLSGHNDDQARRLRKLYRVSGVGRRHSVLLHAQPETTNAQSFFTPAQDDNDQGPRVGARMERYEVEAPKLAEEAARKGLKNAGVLPGAVTHLVTVSCSGFFSPGIDIQLIKKLGLPATTQRIHVGFMGCHGAINGIRTVMGLTAADPNAVVLMVAVELCSIHYQYGWDADRNVANALFADGAAALVAGGTERPGPQDWRATHSGSCLIPDSEDAMSWKIRDHGFQMTLSQEVPRHIGENLRPWLTTWLAERGIGLADIKSWAIHPGGPSILKACEQSLHLDRSHTAVSWNMLERYGNMSSPTVLFILDALRSSAAPRPCVALAFGPGLMAEATLFT